MYGICFINGATNLEIFIEAKAACHRIPNKAYTALAPGLNIHQVSYLIVDFT